MLGLLGEPERVEVYCVYVAHDYFVGLDCNRDTLTTRKDSCGVDNNIYGDPNVVPRHRLQFSAPEATSSRLETNLTFSEWIYRLEVMWS